MEGKNTNRLRERDRTTRNKECQRWSSV